MKELSEITRGKKFDRFSQFLQCDDFTILCFLDRWEAAHNFYGPNCCSLHVLVICYILLSLQKDVEKLVRNVSESLRFIKRT